MARIVRAFHGGRCRVCNETYDSGSSVAKSGAGWTHVGCAPIECELCGTDQGVEHSKRHGEQLCPECVTERDMRPRNRRPRAGRRW